MALSKVSGGDDPQPPLSRYTRVAARRSSLQCSFFLSSFRQSLPLRERALIQLAFVHLPSSSSLLCPPETTASQSGRTVPKQRGRSDLGDAFHVERVDKVNMPTFSSVVRQSDLPIAYLTSLNLMQTSRDEEPLCRRPRPVAMYNVLAQPGPAWLLRLHRVLSLTLVRRPSIRKGMHLEYCSLPLPPSHNPQALSH